MDFSPTPDRLVPQLDGRFVDAALALVAVVGDVEQQPVTGTK